MLEPHTQQQKNLIAKDELVSANLNVAYIQIQTLINGYDRFWAMPNILATLNHSPAKMSRMMTNNGRMGHLLNTIFDELCTPDPELEPVLAAKIAAEMSAKYPLRVTLSMPTGYSYDEEQNLFVYTPPVVPEPEPEQQPEPQPEPEPGE
jgi:hypothetical protein